jgi:hypothetical protein
VLTCVNVAGLTAWVLSSHYTNVRRYSVHTCMHIHYAIYVCMYIDMCQCCGLTGWVLSFLQSTLFVDTYVHLSLRYVCTYMYICTSFSGNRTAQIRIVLGHRRLNTYLTACVMFFS